jgi:hypothetical protein
MRTKLTAALQLYTAADERIPLFNPTPAFLTMTADGLSEHTGGRARLVQGSPPLALDFGSIATPRVFFLRVEGVDGVDVTLNDGFTKQIRPASDASVAAESIPVGLYLETSNDLTSITLEHPGAAGADDVIVYWQIVGDEAP